LGEKEDSLEPSPSYSVYLFLGIGLAFVGGATIAYMQYTTY